MTHCTVTPTQDSAALVVEQLLETLEKRDLDAFLRVSDNCHDVVVLRKVAQRLAIKVNSYIRVYE